MKAIGAGDLGERRISNSKLMMLELSRSQINVPLDSAQEFVELNAPRVPEVKEWESTTAACEY
jgi:hypothetical protein